MSPRILVLLFVVFSGARTLAQLDIPGADGSDGVFAFVPDAVNPNQMTILLSNASQGPEIEWDTPSPVSGVGVYDPEKWAVVFKYSSVHIPAGKTIVFANNDTRAPVVWLVSGSVVIEGSVDLRGRAGSSNGPAEPGPGGFRGGWPRLSTTAPGSGGLGVGGGHAYGGAGTFATIGAGNAGILYGNAKVLPLVGGSGGSPWFQTYVTCGGWAQPGAGGGAILIAARESIVLSSQGKILVNGGSGGPEACITIGPGRGGSGGAIRLIAETISGAGQLRATGGTNGGGAGRIRIEGNTIQLLDTGDPEASAGRPEHPALIWPQDDFPTIRIAGVGAFDVPADPRADFSAPDLDLGDADSVTVLIEARNLATSTIVTLRIVPRSAPDYSVVATFVEGNALSSFWEAQVDLSVGVAAMQVHADSSP